MKNLYFTFIIILILPASAIKAETNQSKLKSIRELKKFAFGSCNSAYRSQPLWSYIKKENPQLWMWGGDNIYADTSDPEVLVSHYKKQNSIPDYQNLISKIPIIGIWDDHDYGYDNADYSNPFKVEAQKEFLDFILEPLESIRRSQRGVYTSYEFGPPERLVKIIMLDNRYFLNSPEADGMILGEEQWRWLENQIRGSKAKVHFIVSGLSVLSPKIRVTEEWRDHSAAFSRLLDLFKFYNPSGTVFLTGDKHLSTIFKNEGFLEFMSSGLTHSAPVVVRSYVSRFYPITFYGLTFGLVQLEWDEGNNPRINLQIRARREKPVFTRQYKLNRNSQWSSL